MKIIKVLNYNYVLVETDYGVCKVRKRNLNKNKPCISSAINKTEYFINMSNEIHNNKYDYSLVDYENYKQKVKIVCKKHGVFETQPSIHLRGSICPKCSILKHSNNLRLAAQNRSEKLVTDSIGWNKINWGNAGKQSKRFESFKCYIIECFDIENNETFFKVGITFLNLNIRFKKIPYQYKIIKIFESEYDEIFDLETKIQKENKIFKYIPKKEFGGRYECFSQINVNYEIDRNFR